MSSDDDNFKAHSVTTLVVLLFGQIFVLPWINRSNLGDLIFASILFVSELYLLSSTGLYGNQDWMSVQPVDKRGDKVKGGVK